MNFNLQMSRFKSRLIRKRRHWFGIDIVAELLDKEIDSDEMKRILGLDLNDESQLRKLIPKKQYVRYRRLAMVSEQRKALSIVLISLRIENSMKSVLIKAFLYPLFLFNLSLIMMFFVDQILFRTFSSMLDFMGSGLEFTLFQNSIRGLISLDLFMIVMVSGFMIIMKQNPLKGYSWIEKRWINNPWNQLNSFHFISKFLRFYKLGGSFDEIFNQIRWSSDLVLSHKCSLALAALRSGETLSSAVTLIDPKLQLYFKMNEEGIAIESYLSNLNQVQEVLINDRIKQVGKVILAYSYVKITVIIIVIYQMMLKPIEMMGNYL